MSSVRQALLVATVMLCSPLARADVDPLGQYAQAVDIEAPPFHSITPRLSLRYASDRGNGFVGRGWMLAGGSTIERVSRTHGLPNNDPSDLYLLDGMELMPCAAGSLSPSCSTAVTAFGSSTGYYSTKIESFVRIRKDSATGWTIWDRDGTRSAYATFDNGRTFVIQKVTDVHGNHVDYAYACPGPCVIDTITYGNTKTAAGMKIKLYRETRTDPVAVAGGAPLTDRLKSIAVSMNGKPLRAYQLAYTASMVSGSSLLSSVQQYGNDVTLDASGTIKGGTALPAITFATATMTTGPSVAYPTAATPDVTSLLTQGAAPYPHRFVGDVATNPEVEDPLTGYIPPFGTVTGDFDGDGRDDWMSWAIRGPMPSVSNPHSCSAMSFNGILETRTGHGPAIASSLDLGFTVTPAPTSCTVHVWVVDLDGDRRDDLLVYDTGNWIQLISNGDGTFTRAATGNMTWQTDLDACAVGDFDGDGHADIACMFDDNGAVRLFTKRVLAPGIWATSQIELLDGRSGATFVGRHIAAGDFNGDGRADLVVATLEVGGWTLSMGISNGDGTFAWQLAQTTGWRNVVGDVNELVTADFNGDGRADVMFASAVPGASDVVSIGLSISDRGYVDGPDLTGNNATRFALKPAFTAPGLENVSTGDFDGDGKADLLVSTTQSWVRGHGDGQFDTPTGVSTVSKCQPLVADLDGDGRSDILCVVDDLSVPQYTLTDLPSPSSSVDLHNWISGDVTGDGVADLVYVHYYDTCAKGSICQHTKWYQIIVVPSGTGTPVSSAFEATAEEPDTSRFRLVDAGGPDGKPDGKADLVLISKNDAGTLGVYTYLSTGTGTFTAVYDQPWNSQGAIASYGSVDLQNWRPVDLDGDGATDFVHFVWLNPGVAIEILMSNGDGSYTGRIPESTPPTVLEYFTSGSAAFTSPDVVDIQSTDVNGDGLTDFVYAEVDPGEPAALTGKIRTLINDGNGGFVATVNGTSVPYFRDMRRLKFADVDGDGLVDLVHVGSRSDGSCLDLTIYSTDGFGGWSSASPASICDSESPFENASLVRFLDVNGDGRDDLILVSARTDQGGPTTPLIVVTNAPPTPGGAWTETTDLQPAIAASYDFEPWRWRTGIDPATGSLTLTSLMMGDSPQIVLHRASDRLTHIDNGVGGTTDVEYAPLIGHRDYLPLGALPRVVSAVTIGDHANTPAVSERITYAFDRANYSNVLHRMVGFATQATQDHLAKHTTTNCKQLEGAPPCTIDERCGPRPYEVDTFDLHGVAFAQEAVDYVDPGAAAPYTCNRFARAAYACTSGSCSLMGTTTPTFDAYGNVTATVEVPTATYAKTVATPTATPNYGAYIVDKPISTTVSQLETQWIQKSSMAFTYDSAAPGAVGALGDLTKTGQSDGQSYLITTYHYTKTGLLDLTTSPAGTTTATTYDNTYGLFPTRVTVGPLPTPLVTLYDVDLATGLVSLTTDANGATTSYNFDPLGRPILTIYADSTFASMSYSIAGGHRVVHSATSDGSADGVWIDSWIDGLGRTFHTVRKDGATQDTRFADSSTRADSVSNVYMPAGAPVGWTSFEYDALGRVVTRQACDGSKRSTVFTANTATSYDELGKSRMVHVDGRGGITQVDEINAGVTSSMGYTHDVFGHVIHATDSMAHASTYTYDPLGRLTSSTTPDRGTSTVSYVPNGQVGHVSDAMMQQIDFTYDPIGRMLTRVDTGIAQAPRVVSQYWDHDSTGALSGKSLGRLVEVKDDQGTADPSESYVYDIMGRPISSTRCVDTTCQTMEQSFDAGGRLQTLTYPDKESVTYTYDVMGRPVTVGSYATAIYNEVDQPTSLTYQNGLTTTNVYDKARHWTNTVTAQAGRTTLYAATYTHELTGRIHTFNLANGSQMNALYTYDDLGRLTSVASDTAHTESFSYDAIGRFVTSSHNGTYKYNDPLHPHAPTSTTGGDSRAYDPDGNLRALSDASGRALNLTWTADGHVSNVINTVTHNTTAMVYDHNGDRVAKIGAVKDYFFGPYVEQLDGTLVKYYLLGGRLVARNDGKVSYYTQDHRGSTRLVTDDAGGPANRYDYSAFGRSLNKSEHVAQDFELGGGRFDDESGLTYMNARYYDDEIAHFISADSIIPRMYDPQSHHRYSYTEQDPINFSDPSGHSKMQAEWKKELDRTAALVDLTYGGCGGAQGDSSKECSDSNGMTSLTTDVNVDALRDHWDMWRLSANLEPDLPLTHMAQETGSSSPDTRVPPPPPYQPSGAPAPDEDWETIDTPHPGSTRVAAKPTGPPTEPAKTDPAALPYACQPGACIDTELEKILNYAGPGADLGPSHLSLLLEEVRESKQTGTIAPDYEDDFWSELEVSKADRGIWEKDETPYNPAEEQHDPREIEVEHPQIPPLKGRLIGGPGAGPPTPSSRNVSMRAWPPPRNVRAIESNFEIRRE